MEVHEMQCAACRSVSTTVEAVCWECHRRLAARVAELERHRDEARRLVAELVGQLDLARELIRLLIPERRQGCLCVGCLRDEIEAHGTAEMGEPNT